MQAFSSQHVASSVAVCATSAGMMQIGWWFCWAPSKTWSTPSTASPETVPCCAQSRRDQRKGFRRKAQRLSGADHVLIELPGLATVVLLHVTAHSPPPVLVSHGHVVRAPEFCGTLFAESGCRRLALGVRQDCDPAARARVPEAKVLRKTTKLLKPISLLLTGADRLGGRYKQFRRRRSNGGRRLHSTGMSWPPSDRSGRRTGWKRRWPLSTGGTGAGSVEKRQSSVSRLTGLPAGGAVGSGAGSLGDAARDREVAAVGVAGHRGGAGVG